ncbi:MAG: polysaccharide pyruvyl transferase family protein [Candidatus Pacebacteria bacterium]|nr:polysaccharide pyruvyl transferase family protein [Candidatus Paceibacterota bacterium]
MNKIKLYWLNQDRNFGDMLTPILFERLGVLFEKASEDDKEKLLAIGSVIFVSKENDVVWGSGVMSDNDFQAPKGLKVLAVRGPKTKEKLKNCEVPDIFGDPAILMPDVYTPKPQERHEIGFVPHYVDVDNERLKGKYMIDVKSDPLETIDRICSCDMIVSSSLHGIIIAEAYGIPAVWVKLSDKIIGNSFKFNDYFLGSGRQEQEPSKFGDWKVLPKPKYEKENLLKSLKQWLDLHNFKILI